MFYLYCSGYRSQYANTIFKTLGYPSGMINRHYYRCEGENNHVSPPANQKLKNLNNARQDVIIVIVDRNSNGYRYYPVRKAILISHKYENDSLYMYVKLGDFIFPKNIQQTEELLKAYCPDLPKLNGTPDCTHDGAYVTIGKSVINVSGGPSNFYEESKDGIEVWKKVVENVNNISTLHYTENEKSYNPFFMRFTVRCEDGFETKLRERGLTSYYSISPKKRYQLVVYGDNLNLQNGISPKVKISIQKNHNANTQCFLDYSLQSGEVTYNLDLLNDESGSCCIDLSIENSNVKESLLGINTQIDFSYKKKLKTVFLVWIVFPIIYVFSSFIAAHYGDIQGKAIKDIYNYVRGNFMSLITYTIQIFSIIGITYLNNGNKIF